MKTFAALALISFGSAYGLMEAHLIAAAHDLYNFATRVANEPSIHPENLREMAREVMRKARGEA